MTSDQVFGAFDQCHFNPPTRNAPIEGSGAAERRCLATVLFGDGNAGEQQRKGPPIFDT